MGVIASLDERDVAVEAGESVTCAVRLHNNGRIVDTFTLDVLGEAADWASVEPETVNVFPGDDAVAVITFAPPRSADVPCGKKAFALRVMAQEDTDGSVIEEGTVEVLGFSDVAAELVPRTARGARVARTKLAVDNLGNGPVTVQFSGKDESGAVAFRFKPVQSVVEGGTTQLIPVRMKMKHRFLTGQPKTVPVEIDVTGSDGTKLQTTGAVIQPALLPRWLPKAVTFAVAGVVLLAVLAPAFFDDKPTSKAVTGGQADPGAKDGATPPPSGEASPSDGATPPAGEQGEDGGAGGATDETGGQAPAGTGTGTGTGTGSGGSGGGGNSTGSGSSGTSSGSGGSKGSAAKPAAGGKTDPVSENIIITARGNPDVSTFMTSSRVVGAGQTVTVGEVVLTKQAGAAGALEIRKNSTVLLKRDLAAMPMSQRARFSGTVTFKAGDTMVVAVKCESSSSTCMPKALFPAKVAKS